MQGQTFTDMFKCKVNMTFNKLILALSERKRKSYWYWKSVQYVQTLIISYATQCLYRETTGTSTTRYLLLFDLILLHCLTWTMYIFAFLAKNFLFQRVSSGLHLGPWISFKHVYNMSQITLGFTVNILGNYEHVI